MNLIVYNRIDLESEFKIEDIPPLGNTLKNHLMEYRNLERRKTSLSAWQLLFRTMKENNLFDEDSPVDSFVDFEPAGKPYFKNRQDVFFSISHAGSLAAVALSDRPVGMDLEIVRNNYTDSMIRRCLSEEEMARFDLRPEIRNEEFTKMWCKKEAISKLQGTGLARVISEINTLSEEYVFDEKRIALNEEQYYLITVQEKTVKTVK